VIPALISSYALLTPFGDAEQTWSALLDGRCLGESARVDLAVAGQHRRVTALALHVAREAMASGHGPPLRGVGTPTHHRLHDTAMIVGTSKGEIDAWLSEPAGGLDPAGLAEISGCLARELRIGGPVLTASAACASGLIALVRGVLMLRSGEAGRVLVVAAESSFHPLLLASYRRLGVLADPAVGCRPFDRDRGGFFVGEAAAAVLLEAGDRGVCVDGYAMGSDAVSITAADPSGAVMRRLIQRAAGGRGLDLVHAHGTGTVLNDPIELAAIDSALADHGPTPVYSHKCALGHTLGASGLVSVVLNCMAHGRGLIPPNSRTPNPLPGGRAIISATPLSQPIRRSMAIAAGFGGAAAALALQTRSQS
jgi:3-oxoacyl-[acyl-carrier-protein] synthase II